MTEEKKTTRKKKPSAKSGVDQTVEPSPAAQQDEPWLYQTPIKHTVTLKEPTHHEPGLGLFFLDDGSVRWSVVSLNTNSGGNE